MSYRERLLEAASKKAAWNEKVGVILSGIGRLANLYLVMGLGLYGLGSAIIIYFLRHQPLLVTLVVMYFFQLCIVFFSTKVIYPCIGGGFWVSLLANNESIPTFDRLGRVLEKMEKKLDDPALDIQGEAGRIREELREIRNALTKPVAQSITRIGKAPVVQTEAMSGKADGNGQ